MDNTTMWDTMKDLETYWWRMIDYLELVGTEDVAFNP